jgi:queuine tRNA-ribosyltransferase
VRLDLRVEARCGEARAGVLSTPRGEVPTPCFMPVGTRGAVRMLAAHDLEDLGARIVLGNTYHLMLKPGAGLVAALGGLHGFTTWSGPILTDSGGYQVFSLEPAVDDDGATFRSTYDGSTHRLTPEGAVEVQALLGADMQMVLDVCPPLPSRPEILRLAVDRTSAWAVRAREAFLALERPDLAQLGIVQGGTDAGLRTESAQHTVAIGFDGYAVGGLSVGEDRDAMLAALEVTVAQLPEDQPRYVMGLGDPVGMVEAIALGADLFDSVLPSRHGRHGTVLTSGGRFNLKRTDNALDDGPLDATCGCPTCARYSRAYLRHLLVVGEPTCRRLVTVHNLHWTLRLVERARAAVLDGTLDAVRREVAAAWP